MAASPGQAIVPCPAAPVRCGLKHKLRSQDVECDLGEALLEALKEAGTPGTLSFGNPDTAVAIDTLEKRAGIGFGTPEDLKRHGDHSTWLPPVRAILRI
jgi:tRNA(Ser,Leu) C12 N-acetylase TAN1